MAEPAIVDSSPLIVLSRADELRLLQMVAAHVVLPAAVYREIAAYGPNDHTVLAVAGTPWLEVVPSPALPEAVAALDLGPGESEVIAWAVAHPGCQAIIDDLEARRHADSLGLSVVGTVGLVLRAKQSGIIPEARPVLQILRQAGLYLSDSVMHQALSRVGE